MGILPLQFLEGENPKSLGLNGDETFDIEIGNDTQPGDKLNVKATSTDGTTISFQTRSRIDTPVEIQYYRDGGILCTVLKNLARK